jgi:maltose/moltooligosaccharide transporter
MKLNYKRTFFVGLAFMSICSFWQLYDSIVPLILKNTFNVNDAAAGAVMAADNVLALFLLPLFGMLSDKTNTRFGRRTPYILFGTLAASIFMLLIPIADNLNSMVIFVVALGFALILMSTYRSAAVALMPDVTPKPLRSKANAVINLMGAVGGIIALGLIATLVPRVSKPNYMVVFICISVIMLVSVAIMLTTIKEKKLVEELKEQIYEDEAGNESGGMPADVRRSLGFLLLSVFLWFIGYNAITTAFSKYAQVYWGLEGGLFAYTLIIAQVAAILSYIPVGIVASKVGRKKTIIAGIIILAFAFGAAAFFQNFNTTIFFFFALAGLGWASINVNSYPMVVEMSRGCDVGKYTGLYYTFSMSAQILTPIVSGALLQYVGYWTLFPYGSLFVALALVTMLFVKHGDNKPALPAARIEAFDVAGD